MSIREEMKRMKHMDLIKRATALLLVVAFTAAACSSPGNDRTTANTSAPAVFPTVGSLPKPIMAGQPTDNLPTYTCAADAFASYYTLQVIQQAKLDVKYGFHLAIVPFLLDNQSAYDINEEQRVAALAAGQWDCLLTTLDSVALHGESGQITAIVDESAGADQLWAKPNIATLNDLRGHKIAVTQGSVSEFFTYYVLSVGGVTVDPSTGATIVEANSITDAVDAFNSGKADAVSGWDPDIDAASKGGGKQLISTDTLRVVVDVIVTSRQAIAGKPDQVQAFHNAWFEALKMASEDFDKFAGYVAAWGHNDWSGVSTDKASDDLKGALGLVAQASLDANRIAMQDLGIIQERIDQARRVWAAAGQSPTPGSGAAIEPKFVLAAAAKPELRTDKPLPNPSFYMTAHPSFTALSAEDADKAQTLAVLPCQTFEFEPGKTTLTTTSTQSLQDCVVPILHSSPDVYLVVLGSAAWPVGETEQSTRDFAMKRAQAVADFLVGQGIDRERLVLKATVPPPERRNLGDNREDDRKKDRFVRLTLILTGR
jgi:ABC-type nitrate/sulfonate/bicarbonate transport system substrate-binding protein/outer membrane protein OmpA-like peptidoglycan-associated protein